MRCKAAGNFTRGARRPGEPAGASFKDRRGRVYPSHRAMRATASRISSAERA
jgi:hypothetical protein